MKKFFLIVLTIVCAALITSCKNDPAVIPPYLQNPQLIGKWQLKSVEIKTEVSDIDDLPTDFYSDFTPNDYFEFKDNNAAMYSSSLIGKTYTGYYSTRADATPQTLNFKSANFNINFFIESISSNELVLYQTRSITDDNDVTTTVTSTYTYSH
ncbi:lipocalin family protein [Mucilaginibacter lacusdianchii]|uniref:lipocalin family protein n=1 Tax=Mucilaginibacter lacusdianchii TaxID=2684211 RepID=UPI00131C33DE|nr:lipocalin family protein [Mucilaginibacter sp. JXJ CY 39]